MESGAALRASRISAFLSIKYWPTGAIVEYLFDCAAALGPRKQMPSTSTKAITVITLSLVLFLVGLIATYPSVAAAARFLLSFRLYPQPAVSQSVQVHT